VDCLRAPSRVHLAAGQEQQEVESQQVEDINAANWLDQIEALRADGDAREHLQDDRRHQPPPPRPRRCQ